MEIKKELLARIIGDEIIRSVDFLGINLSEMADSMAIKALSEIQEILCEDDPTNPDPAADFMTIEKILDVFNKYGFYSGGCHDF